MMAKRANKWFIKVRGSYLPSSAKGWLTYVPYLAYMIAVLVYAIQRIDDVWLGVFLVIPNFVAAAVIMNWVASVRS